MKFMKIYENEMPYHVGYRKTCRWSWYQMLQMEYVNNFLPIAILLILNYGQTSTQLGTVYLQKVIVQ